jgi:large subunit ribosomal protein L1
MAKMGKKHKAALSQVEPKVYEIKEAIELLKKIHYAKFDESVDLVLNLGVNPKYADQNVRGTTSLPHGLGKKVRVLVIAQGEKMKEAEDAGADYVLGLEAIEKIQGGWFDFDAVVSTPDMMKDVGKLGKQLGPKGLMPNPKLGTVTFEVAKAVNDLKAGRVEFRVNKEGVLHSAVGKMSFDEIKLEENLRSLLDAVVKARPASLKGKYIKSAYISSTMSPGISILVREL